jgi:methionyl-tRNA formyltransferase
MHRVTVICSDPCHPVNAVLAEWVESVREVADVRIVRKGAEAIGGDFLFLVSCHEMIRSDTRARYRHVLVLHASALPEGRGMSPHVWQLLEGRSNLTMTLLNAEDQLDSGDVWNQTSIHVPVSATFEEINAILFSAQTSLMTWALQHCDRVQPRPQVGTPTYYRKRTPSDSEVDPRQSLAEMFNVLRTADPDRYPAFFRLHGRIYKISIEPSS